MLKAQLKLSKTAITIRPIINNRTAPSYSLAKYLAKIINQYIIMNNHCNALNFSTLANDLTKLKINENHRMLTFDIKDLYVHIPTDEIINIIKTKLLQNSNLQTIHIILSLLNVIISQNYFTFQQKNYQPEQVVSMGSPISSLIAGICLQHYEGLHIQTSPGY